MTALIALIRPARADHQSVFARFAEALGRRARVCVRRKPGDAEAA